MIIDEQSVSLKRGNLALLLRSADFQNVPKTKLLATLFSGSRIFGNSDLL